MSAGLKAVHLLGFRGAGKTTLGLMLARDLGANFYDLDQLWEARRGTSIVEWVKTHGVEAFRATECELLREIDSEVRVGATPRVVALGGGVVDYGPSRAVLEASPVPKVYLEVPAEELWARLKGDPQRLQIGNLRTLAALGELLSRRAPYFEKIATRTVVNRDINECFHELKQLVNSLWQPAH